MNLRGTKSIEVMFWKAGLLLMFQGLVAVWTVCEQKSCHFFWEISVHIPETGWAKAVFGNGAWVSLCCLLNRVTHTKTSTSAVWHAPKPTGQKGSANQIKPVLEQLELYAFLNQNINVKCLINTSQCTAALTWHRCSGLMGGRAGSSCSPMHQKDGEILWVCISKAIICISPQPEAMGHPLLSMVKNVSSQRWGKFWNSPRVPGMQTQYRHWQIRVNSFGAL